MRQGIWTLGVALFVTAFVFCFADPTWFQGWGTEQARRAGTRSADLDVITAIARSLRSAMSGESAAKEKALTPDPFCLKIEADGWARTQAAKAYANAALREFNVLFHQLNDGLLASANATVCTLTRGLGITPAGATLPQAAEGMVAGHYVHIDAEVPTEAWAKGWGYKFKATVTVDGATASIVYWSGEIGNSKGFRIQGIHGVSDEVMKRPGYLQWDETGAERYVRWFGAEFDEAYLNNAATPADKALRADRALHAELQYHNLTGAASLYAVSMEPQRGSPQSSAQFGCFRVYARGTKGDAMLVAHTGGAQALTGHARNTTFRDASELAAVWLRDLPISPADEGQLTDFQFSSLVEVELDQTPFRWTCNDLYTAGIHAGPFGGTDSDVNFDAQPADVF